MKKKALLSAPLEKAIQAFMKKHRYTSFEVDPDGELTFFDGREPFGVTEYTKGSLIKIAWARLQRQVNKEAKRK